MPEEPHDTSGLDCWCEPKVNAECPRCGKDVPRFGNRMTLCRGCGWKGHPIDGPLVVIHRTNRLRGA